MPRNTETFSGQTQEQSAENQADYSIPGADLPPFDPKLAEELKRQKMGEIERGREDESPETRFNVDPKEFPNFAKQSEIIGFNKDNSAIRETFSINETLGKMVGSTAAAIATLVGENENNIPAADHVIYLDKSARPVSWLVKEFWQDFTDRDMPPASFLNIDRVEWFKRSGVELLPNEYVEENSGERRPADARDFKIEKISKELIAGIRAYYIDGGVESEDPEKIMATPTILDGKDITIIDEVSRTGSTLDIAKELIKTAIPDAKSVNGYVFWPSGTIHNRASERQMQSSPVWYDDDSKRWEGRGIKDPDPKYYEEKFKNEPTNVNRALKLASHVLGVPLEPNEDPLTIEFQNEIHAMHEEYSKGHVLPSAEKITTESGNGDVCDRLMEQVESWGVEFSPENSAKNPKHTYLSLAAKRDFRPSKMRKW